MISLFPPTDTCPVYSFAASDPHVAFVHYTEPQRESACAAPAAMEGEETDSSRPINLILKLRGGRNPVKRAPPRPVRREEWTPPSMVRPDPGPEDMPDRPSVDRGAVDTDARLYVLPETLHDGSEKVHSVLCMPTVLPETEVDRISSSKTFNILMADVSVSMSCYWKAVVQGWNRYVAPTLKGRTSLYVFSNQVFFQRSGTFLEQGDYYSGATDLVGALQTIVTEVYQCKEKYVKVFLITDGDHSLSQRKPEDIIEKMQFPLGKVCEVYVLGVGNEFPVQHSIGIRSRLHNGKSNLPYLYTAKNADDVREQMVAIGRSLTIHGQAITLSVEGSSLPGTKTKYSFQPGEWVYFPYEPSRLQHLTIAFDKNKGNITLNPIPMDFANLNELFRQWNSMIIQLYRNGKHEEGVVADVLSLKERLFSTQVKKLRKGSTFTVSDRLARKELANHEANFKANANKLESILSKTFRDEQELADNVLCTTAGGTKYETRVFKLKGYTDKDFQNDQEEFLKVYALQKDNFLKIEVTPEDCCRITMTSTISDLQDSNFSELFQLGKFEFLKQFTITGIPVFAPTRDSTTINPWSYTIKAMLNSPYTILSQVALESFAEVTPAGERHKDVLIKWDEDNTRFNAIIPVFPAKYAKVMEPFVHTRVYTMCATFAILKNPHIIDFQGHMAALGVAWVYILSNHPTHPRPEFMRTRIQDIEATAALYINRARYSKYWHALRDNTAQALMTESTLQVDGKTLKCETLVKPLFILYVNQRNGNVQDASVVARIVRLILMEYVGRCLSGYNIQDKEATPFTDFFASTIADQDLRKKWLLEYSSNIKRKLLASAGNLLEKYYTFEEVKKAAKRMVSDYLKNGGNLASDLPIRVNIEKVDKLKNVASAGDVSWGVLCTFAREVGLSPDVVSQLFSEQSVFVYIAHALKHRASRVRLAVPVDDYDSSFKLVTKGILRENYRSLAKTLSSQVCADVEETWRKGYAAAHRGVVKPMTRQAIVAEARSKGVAVDETTFDAVYKRYRDDVGLLGNACQSRVCPFFLLPNKRYNQHASVERQLLKETFPHAFHRVAYMDKNKDLAVAVADLQSGSYRKIRQPLDASALDELTDRLQYLQNSYRCCPLEAADEIM